MSFEVFDGLAQLPGNGNGLRDRVIDPNHHGLTGTDEFVRAFQVGLLVNREAAIADGYCSAADFDGRGMKQLLFVVAGL